LATGCVILFAMEGTLARFLPWSVPVALIASVVIVSVLAWLYEPMKRALILNPYRVRENGQIYRLLTSGWLHGDLSHLAVNMLTFYFFADRVLAVLGATRFLVLYVSSVVVASIPSTLRHMRNPHYNSLGASGAVAAVMFSAVLLYPKLKLSLMFRPIPVPGLVFAAAYLAYSAWRSFGTGDNINHGAHFSGAAYGALLTYLFEPARVERSLKQLW
jgi:membrane associated rhomboid family serine protease